MPYARNHVGTVLVEETLPRWWSRVGLWTSRLEVAAADRGGRRDTNARVGYGLEIHRNQAETPVAQIRDRSYSTTAIERTTIRTQAATEGAPVRFLNLGLAVDSPSSPSSPSYQTEQPHCAAHVPNAFVPNWSLTKGYQHATFIRVSRIINSNA